MRLSILHLGDPGRLVEVVARGQRYTRHRPGVFSKDRDRFLREQLAIPHAKFDSPKELIACLGRSRKGIDFGSANGKPTHFFFVLIAPTSAPGVHLKALAQISRLFKDVAFRDRLKAAKTAREMYEVIAQADAG